MDSPIWLVGGFLFLIIKSLLDIVIKSVWLAPFYIICYLALRLLTLLVFWRASSSGRGHTDQSSKKNLSILKFGPSMLV